MSLIAALFVLLPPRRRSILEPTGHLKVLLIGQSYEGNSIDLLPLHGPQDCTLLRQALKQAYRIKPEDIKEVDDATRSQIDSAWSDLASGAVAGDNLIFYYSGHGTLAHDSRGNICSAIIPAGAKRLPNRAFDESTLLTRDYFNSQLAGLAKRSNALSMPIHVTLIFDSCASGSIARGSLLSKFAANPGITATEQPAALPPTDLDLGDAVLIAAARTDRNAYEDSSKKCGVMTFALCSALVDASRSGTDRPGEKLSYRTLRDLMLANETALQTDADQEPVFAAASQLGLDREVFGSDIITSPLKFSLAVRADGTASLDAGSIFGLLPGVRVGLSQPGKANAVGAKPDAIASVVSSTPYNAELKVVGAPSFPPGLAGGQATLQVLDPTPDAVVDVDASLLVDRYAIFRKGLEQPYIRTGSGGAAVVIIPPGQKPEFDPKLSPAAKHDQYVFDSSPTDWIVATPDGHAYAKLGGTESEDTIRDWMVRAVRDIARAQAVLALKSPDPWVRVEVQLVPASTRAAKDAEGNSFEVVTSLDPSKASNSSSAGSGERFVVRVRAFRANGTVTVGVDDAPYISVLDVTAHRSVSTLWPRAGGRLAPERFRLPLDKKWRYLGVQNEFVDEANPADMSAWYFRPNEDGTGRETFKLLATDQYVDFGPYFTTARSGEEGSHTALGRMMDAFRSGRPLTRDVVDEGAAVRAPTRFAVAEVVTSVHFDIAR